MKRFVGVTLFVLLVGIVFVGIGYVSGISNDASFFEESQYSETQLEYEANEIDDFSLIFSNRTVKFYASENDKITIKYYESEHDWVEIDLANEQLELIQKSHWYAGLNFGLWGFQSNDVWIVEIYLPTDVLTYDIDVSTSNGKIMVTGINQLSRLNASSSNGEIKVEGDLYVTDEFDLYTSNGRITVSNVKADCDISLDTSNGKIIATNIDASRLIFDTSNGDIELSVLGDYDDYRIEMDTSNGDCHVDNIEKNDSLYNPNANKLLRLSTSNGDIEIDFIG